MIVPESIDVAQSLLCLSMSRNNLDGDEVRILASSDLSSDRCEALHLIVPSLPNQVDRVHQLIEIIPAQRHDGSTLEEAENLGIHVFGDTFYKPQRSPDRIIADSPLLVQVVEDQDQGFRQFRQRGCR